MATQNYGTAPSRNAATKSSPPRRAFSGFVPLIRSAMNKRTPKPKGK